MQRKAASMIKSMDSLLYGRGFSKTLDRSIQQNKNSEGILLFCINKLTCGINITKGKNMSYKIILTWYKCYKLSYNTFYPFMAFIFISCFFPDLLHPFFLYHLEFLAKHSTEERSQTFAAPVSCDDLNSGVLPGQKFE